MLILKLPSVFTARLFWTFHNKLHSMKALVILHHHDHYFSHLFVFMKQMNFCGSMWALLEYFHEKKTPHSPLFQHRVSYRDLCPNFYVYPVVLPSLKRESPILLFMLISAWLTASRAFNSDEKRLLNVSCLI